MRSPLFRAEDISKSFVKNGVAFRVLERISLDLHAGEVVCLLGPSGSGKTTLLQIFSGMLEPDGGIICSDTKRPGPGLGYLTQADRLLPWRTVRENIALGPELLGFGNPQGTEALLSRVGLEEFHSHYPSQISGGMGQRALLARTLATDPALVLLDEPMNNLDVVARRQMAGVLKDYVRARQAAALVVTHSVEEAAFLADRVILMTRSPAIIDEEISGNLTFDGIMQALMRVLGGVEA